MPSIAVDAQGNMAIGYSVSSSTTEPAINYAGRLANDSLNSLAQGEALLIAGAGHQTSTSGRWGDYSALSIDPADDLTFWHTNEYYSATSSAGWNTRIGRFRFPSPLQLGTAVSRKMHGGLGPFDIDLPFTPVPPGPPPSGVECRSGGPTSDYTMVFTFSNPVTNCGSASTGSVSGGPNPNQCTVNLTGVPNAQHITVTLTGAVDSTGATGDVSATMGVLVGDVNANGSVSNTDVASVKAQIAAPVDSSNFRNDVNANGVISNTDVSATKAQVGTALP
jgi:hypothetical protein